MKKSKIIFFMLVVHVVINIMSVSVKTQKLFQKLFTGALAYSGICVHEKITNYYKIANFHNKDFNRNNFNKDNINVSYVDIVNDHISVDNNSITVPFGNIKDIIIDAKKTISNNNITFINEQDEIKKITGLDFFDFLELCLQEEYICNNTGEFFINDEMGLKIGDFIYRYGEYLENKNADKNKEIRSVNLNDEEVYVVTDTQGNAAGVAYAILTALKNKKKILFLGDYEGLRKRDNKGSATASLLATLLIGLAKKHPDIICVKGNHEVNFNESYQDFGIVLSNIARLNKEKFDKNKLMSIIYDTINAHLPISIVNINFAGKKQIFKHCASPVCNFSNNFLSNDPINDRTYAIFK